MMGEAATADATPARTPGAPTVLLGAIPARRFGPVGQVMVAVVEDVEGVEEAGVVSAEVEEEAAAEAVPAGRGSMSSRLWTIGGFMG